MSSDLLAAGPVEVASAVLVGYLVALWSYRIVVLGKRLISSFGHSTTSDFFTDPWTPCCPQCFQLRPDARNWQRCECGGMFVPFFIAPESGYTFRSLPPLPPSLPSGDASPRVVSGQEHVDLEVRR